jgi:hypothetical protein
MGTKVCMLAAVCMFLAYCSAAIAQQPAQVKIKPMSLDALVAKARAEITTAQLAACRASIENGPKGVTQTQYKVAGAIQPHRGSTCELSRYGNPLGFKSKPQAGELAVAYIVPVVATSGTALTSTFGCVYVLRQGRWQLDQNIVAPRLTDRYSGCRDIGQ